jgi:N-acetylmuramoyl-L-alanine amidase
MTEVLRLSPNQDARAHPIRVIVIHADASPNEEGTLGWLENPKSKVSYHVLIGRKGTKYRCVLDTRRAWAVGYSAWRGARNINGIALNVAFANRNDGREPLTSAQIASARDVITEWRAKWQIEDTTTHQIVSRWKDGRELHNGQRRKHDPEAAPNFDLRDFV